jgi:hypothetical protein
LSQSPVAEPEEDETQSEPTVESQSPSTNGEAKWEVTYIREENIINSLDEGEVHCLYEITNTGTVPLNLNGGSYDVYDTDGNILEVGEYLSEWNKIVMPGEIGYIYEDSSSSSNYTGEVVVEEILEIKAAKTIPHSYALTDVQVVEGDSWGIKVTGYFNNDTDATVDKYDGGVHYCIYGQEGRPIDIGGLGYLDREVPAGGKIPFELEISGWFALFGEEYDYAWAKDHIDIWA